MFALVVFLIASIINIACEPQIMVHIEVAICVVSLFLSGSKESQ